EPRRLREPRRQYARWPHPPGAAPGRLIGVPLMQRTVTMWRNYWTVAVRALAKSKTYSIINIAGLAIGMAACIMIFLYINYEQSYDEWLPDVENTYELQTWYPHPSLGGEPGFLQMSNYVAKDRVKKDF